VPSSLFAGGRSTTKVYAFLIYLFVLFCIAIVKPKIITQKLNEEKNKNLLLHSIGVLFLLGLLGLIFLMQKYGFNFNDYIALFNNSEFSSTSITHNHIGKGLIGYILSYLGYTHFEAIDAGHAFIGIIPFWFYIIFGAVLIYTLVLTFLVFIKECQKSNPRIIYIILYAIVSFGVLEHTLDGGLFDPRVPLLFIFFGVLLFGFSKAKGKVVAVVALLSVVLAVVYFKLGVISDEDTLGRLLMTLVAYIGLLVIPFIFLYKEVPTRLKWLLSIFAFLLMTPFFINVDSLSTYHNISTLNDSAYLAVYPSSGPVPYKVVDKFGDLKVYEVQGGLFRNVDEIISHYNLLDNILPVTVPWGTCFPIGEKKTFSFSLRTPVSLTKLSSTTPLSSTTATQIPSDIKNIKQYFVHMEFNGCTPRYINAIEEIIKSLGTNTFMISDITN
jgi:hypothetical protein